jgi:hypothetical protein
MSEIQDDRKPVKNSFSAPSGLGAGRSPALSYCCDQYHREGESGQIHNENGGDVSGLWILNPQRLPHSSTSRKPKPYYTPALSIVEALAW